MSTRVDHNACTEAFGAWYTCLSVTAATDHWLEAAVSSLCGYGTSVIGCDAEIAVEHSVPKSDSPDGQPGKSILAFGFRSGPLGRAVANRVGQAVLTCPTAAVFDGLPEAPQRAALGDFLRYFGDGHEQPCDNGWRLPIMEGEVDLPATVGLQRGVAGGALLLCGRTQAEALIAAEQAAQAIRETRGVIAPFPGGICRSGSKVGSRYKRLIASTNEPYCPTLSSRIETKLPPGTECVYEIVINGVDEPAVRKGLKSAIAAACDTGLLAITACDYGGQLGRISIRLGELVAG